MHYRLDRLGPVTFLQAVLLVALNIIGGIISSVRSCTSTTGGSCSGDTQVSIVLVLLTVIWFGFLAILGYAAQQRRGRVLSTLLGIFEAGVALVALFDLMHFNSVIGFITSAVDLALALVVIYLSFHIFRVGNTRASAKPKPRPHSHTKQ